MRYWYPNDNLIGYATKKWNHIQDSLHRTQIGSELEDVLHKQKTLFPDAVSLKNMLDVVYHTSFLVEELRRIAVRIAYMPMDMSVESVENFEGKPLRFSTPFSFTTTELLKLAPALDANKSIILIGPNKFPKSKSDINALVIWGIYHQGSEWWRCITGKESTGFCPPNFFTLSTFAPGNITASTLGIIVFRLNAGNLLYSTLKELNQGHVGSYFKDAVNSLYKDSCKKLGRKKYDDEKDENQYPMLRFFQTLQNVINIIADKRHGATLIFLSNELVNNPEVIKRLSIKYNIESPNIWKKLIEECVANRKYYHFLFPVAGEFTTLEEMKEAPAKKLKSLIRWKEDRDSAMSDIAEYASFISSLSAVDGAVVLSDRLKVYGFGAEITVSSALPDVVRVAKDPYGRRFQEKSTALYGTRHRSAFRFCSDVDNSFCIVISQDGPVRAIRKISGNLYMWDNIQFGSSGL